MSELTSVPAAARSWKSAKDLHALLVGVEEPAAPLLAAREDLLVEGPDSLGGILRLALGLIGVGRHAHPFSGPPGLACQSPDRIAFELRSLQMRYDRAIGNRVPGDRRRNGHGDRCR